MAIGRDLAQQLAAQYANEYGLPPDLYSRLITQESNWYPNAVSHAGAFGLSQAMPATWSQPGFGVQPGGDRRDPKEQLRFGADYAGTMYERYNGDPVLMSIAYNAGPGVADNWDGNLSSLPAETQDYVQKVAMGEGAGSFPLSPDSGGTIADEDGSSNSPITLADEEQEGIVFNPGVGLQSLGAAIAAGSQGKSASEELARIRANFNDEQQQQYEREVAERQRQAAIQMVGADTEFGRALAEGADPVHVLPAWQQQQSFEQDERMFDRRASHDLSMQERGFTHDDDMFKKRTLSEWGMLDRQLGATSEEKAKDRELRLEELGEDRYQWETEFNARADELAEEAAITGNRGKAAKTLLAEQYDRAGMQTEAAKIRQMPDEAFADPSMVNNFSDMLASGGGDMTTKMKDFAYYTELQARDPEKAKKFWETYGRDKTEINLTPKMNEKAFESDVGRADKLIDEQQISYDALDALDAVDRALQQNPELTTGSVHDLLSPVLNIARDLGMTTEDFGKDQTVRQMIDQINTFMATTIKTPGQISNYEQQSFKAAVPGVSQPIDLLRQNVDRWKKLHERGLNRAEYIYDRIRQQDEEGAQISNFANASKEWKSMTKRGDPQTRPIMHNFDDFTTENLQAMGEVVPGQWVYQDGEMVPIVDQETADDYNSILFSQQ